MTPTLERAPLSLILMGTLLIGCGSAETGEGTGMPTVTGAGTTTPTALLADPAQESLPAFGDGAQTLPFADPVTPFADPVTPTPGPFGASSLENAGRLGGNDDTLGNAGDPSGLPGGAVDAPSTVPPSVAGDPSALPSIGTTTSFDAPEVLFTADSFTGLWTPLDPVLAAPREVLRIAAVPGVQWQVLSFLDRSEQSGDAPGNCFEAAGGGAYGLVERALRPVAELLAVQDYHEYTYENGFLVLTSYVTPAATGQTSTVYARTLPGLAAQDLPVCDATQG